MPTDPDAEFIRRLHQLPWEQADDLREILVRSQEAAAPSGAPASRDHTRILSSTRSSDRQALSSRAGINAPQRQQVRPGQ